MKPMKATAVFMFLAVFSAGIPAKADHGGKKVEFTLYGGYSMFAGTGSASNNPGNLYTGNWSPFFGAGYDLFSWSAAVADLDAVVGKSILERKSGPQFGLKIGYRLSPRIQVEGFFEYSLSKFRFTEAAWKDYEDVLVEAWDTLEAFGRDLDEDDRSIREDGSALNFGLNVNFDLAMDGMTIPYISLGASVSMLKGFPSIDYVLTQSIGAANAAYGVVLNYADVTAFGFGGGIGARFYMNDKMGFKVEARGTYLPVTVDQRFASTFSRVGVGWLVFPEFDDIAAVEKLNPFVITLNAGFFFGM